MKIVNNIEFEYQPSGAGATHSPPATLAKFKIAARGLKMFWKLQSTFAK